ncbi:copper transporter [Gordonia alkaliphila]|uniref:copper transporter n=1 Tax=Gordonia alkaliphila TaxID=1053547 RepID=UPI001FF2F749|nr:copper transporter [Gordonia alkaliphila]MCK0440830.1 copper transporter [Gordonia alkaliphila]
MISLRQHAISLIAVFLALALGLFLGSGFIGDRVNQLTGTERDRLGVAENERDALARQVNVDQGFLTAVTPELVGGTLVGKSVLVVTGPTAADTDTEAVKALLADAGADYSGQLSLRTTLVRDENAAKLSTIVDQSVPAGQQLRTDFSDSGSRVGDLLGAALLVRDGARPVPEQDRATVLQTLREGGFLDYADGTVKPADLVVVMTGGAVPADSGAQGQLLGRLASAMAQRGQGGVLAGRDGSADGSAAIAVVRSDPGLGNSLSTVDDVNEQTGRLTVILALQAESEGRSGAYGTGKGAASITVTAPGR